MQHKKTPQSIYIMRKGVKNQHSTQESGSLTETY